VQDPGKDQGSGKRCMNVPALYIAFFSGLQSWQTNKEQSQISVLLLINIFFLNAAKTFLFKQKKNTFPPRVYCIHQSCVFLCSCANHFKPMIMMYVCDLMYLGGQGWVLQSCSSWGGRRELTHRLCSAASLVCLFRQMTTASCTPEIRKQ